MSLTFQKIILNYQRTNKYDIFIPKQFFSAAFAPMKSKTDTIIYYNKKVWGF